MKKHFPNYIKKLINNFPDILSGRKNYKKHHERVEKNIYLTKKYKNKKIKS